VEIIMPSPLKLPDEVIKLSNGRWARNCPKCNAQITHLRRNYCIGAFNIEQPCKRCSNINNHPSGMVGAVRVAWFESFKKSALTRGYCWEITIEFVDALYEQQQGVCALSGIPISWSVVNWNHTASLDRIDNSVGYTPENVQIVDKRINMMRGSLAVDDFVELCNLVANKEKW
jgi:hypothetical protein